MKTVISVETMQIFVKTVYDKRKPEVSDSGKTAISIAVSVIVTARLGVCA